MRMVWFSARPVRWSYREWVVLTAVAIAFVSSGAMVLSRSPALAHNITAQRDVDPNCYRQWYEAHQMYGGEPEQLNRFQWANVQNWCRCLDLMEKYVSLGCDSLSQEDCAALAEGLSRRFARLNEFPAYQAIFDACRARLHKRPASGG